MPTIWKIPSVPPHDFFLSLDVNEYFDHEHQPEKIFDDGFTRSVPLSDRDILVTVRFNGDVETPEFAVATGEILNDDEKAKATKALRRILGCDLDLKPFYQQAGNDPVIGGLIREYYGFKRISRANFFEDAMNRIIQTQISHKPTARKMVYGVRAAYGEQIPHKNSTLASWPRPHQLVGADPDAMKQYGLSVRKGEYIIGLAHEITSGNLDLDVLEAASPVDFYQRVTSIRGIGPTTAQDLMHMRNRMDGFFPAKIEKGRETGLRRWIALSYGVDADTLDETGFQELISLWKGYEACAVELLFLNWIMTDRKKTQKSE